jgi:hypothetical protein
MAKPPERPRGERWSNPLTVAVVAAALAGFSNLWLAYENNRAALALERSRAESERILEMLKAGDPARVRENLHFLLQLGLVQDEELRRRIEAWEANPNRSPIYLSPAGTTGTEAGGGAPTGTGAGRSAAQRPAVETDRDSGGY